MAFNKGNYWANRRNGVRGQGEGPKTSLIHRALHAAINRARSRRRVHDHRLTSKTARIRSDKESAERIARVKKTELGERMRIDNKRREANAASRSAR